MTAHLVHGMGQEEVPATWPPLDDTEVRRLLARYREALGPGDPGRATVAWRSPRPWSAAALVDVPGRFGALRLFVKRHPPGLRTPADLAVEHGLAALVRAGGIVVPEVLRDDTGATAVAAAAGVYEVQSAAPGLDLYREVPSWQPYACPLHARTAGRALARFHRAAATFPAPARPAGPLVVSTAVVASGDPCGALGNLFEERPALAAAVDPATVQRDFVRWHLPAVERVQPLLARCGDGWGHGDWHPSNLTWTASGAAARVAAVLDLGLANRTAAVHDLAVAIERAGVDWLAPAGRVRADLPAVTALLRGYGDERPLTDAERAALPDAVRVAHVEYALSEVEYFAACARSPGDVTLAYRDYFVGHGEWFASPAGGDLLDAVRRAVSA